MKRYAKVLGLLLGVAVVVSSCDRNLYYSDNQSVNESGWGLDTPLEYEVEITDTMQYFDIFIDLRNSVDYGFANTFLFITTTFPDSTFAKDTLECPLADETGRWYGKSSGRYVDNRYYFRRKVRFPQMGTYRFSIIHGMRSEKLEGLKDVGLRFEKHQDNN